MGVNQTYESQITQSSQNTVQFPLKVGHLKQVKLI